ncbi:MAG: hypothetical protein ACJA06_001366 [Halocynthiibacter sp.]|jgi:hypothetical protein
MLTKFDAYISCETKPKRTKMSLNKFMIALAAVATLPACSDLIKDANTHSNFSTPNSVGVYSTALSSQLTGRDTAPDGDGYGYRVGSRSGTGLIGQSGIIPGTSVAAAPASGSVVYSGRYELAQIQNIDISGSRIYGHSSLYSRSISLTADFDGNTLSGTGGNLSVDGAISNGNLSGNVTYKGVNGALDGVIGADRAVGAFHGNSADTIYAGGFIVDAD